MFFRTVRGLKEIPILKNLVPQRMYVLQDKYVLKVTAGSISGPLLREASILRWLDGHPHINKLVGCYRIQYPPAIGLVYPQARGSLYDVWAHMSPEDRVKRFDSYAYQLVKGLAYMHSHGVIHRNITPHHILVSSSGKRVYFTDFKEALSQFTPSETRLESSYYTKNKYRPPETWTETPLKHIDPRFDVWSLGLVIYEMLTGKKKVPTQFPRPFLSGMLGAKIHERAQSLELIKEFPDQVTQMVDQTYPAPKYCRTNHLCYKHNVSFHCSAQYPRNLHPQRKIHLDFLEHLCPSFPVFCFASRLLDVYGQNVSGQYQEIHVYACAYMAHHILQVHPEKRLTQCTERVFDICQNLQFHLHCVTLATLLSQRDNMVDTQKAIALIKDRDIMQRHSLEEVAQMI